MHISVEQIAALGAVFVAVLGAIGTLITAIRVGKVHTLVNNQHSQEMREISNLRAIIAARSGNAGDVALAKQAAENAAGVPTVEIKK